MKLSENPKYIFVRKLRAKGCSYHEIATNASVLIPRSTVVTWCKGIQLSISAKKRLKQWIRKKLKKAQENSANSSRRRKLERKAYAAKQASGFENHLKEYQVKRIILGTLYLAEGTKGDRSALTFCNSDPNIIKLYLELLRDSFEVNERKFRCTLQAREGQNIRKLENFWSKLTCIPKTQFYKARIDPRGKGKILRKPDYKGVCRLDYISTETLYEVQAIGRILASGR